jgi:ribulose 1,5-bisphosphate synthetase/thiazole synthase
MFIFNKRISTSPISLAFDHSRSNYLDTVGKREEMAIKRVAIIGLGPSGAITIDALAREKAFDKIRVFERKNAPGGCW